MTISRWSAELTDLLKRLGRDSSLGNQRFVPRNFLLDCRPPRVRIDDYERYADSATDLDSWWNAHDSYLEDHIRKTSVVRPGASVVDPADAADTFTKEPLLTPFGSAGEDLDLVRVVAVRTLARLADVPVAEVLSAMSTPVAIQALLDDASDRLDARPSFAGFWENVADDVGETEAEGREDWADRLRNRFGLLPVVPAPGQAIPVVLLRYSVGDIPRVRGLRGRRPLVVPTVLDAEFFEAFCPAPPSLTVGQLVNLEPSVDNPPASEILHPPLRFELKHVFRVGNVVSAIGPLADARAFHLMWLREQTETDFGRDTDSDLLT